MYSNNPNLPRVRGEAVSLVLKGWSIRRTARYLGYTHSAVVKWMKRAKVRWCGQIPTRSSRPKKNPRALPAETVSAIITERIGRKRYAEHVYYALKNKGVAISLFSVKRMLDRCHLRKKRSPWKRPHGFTSRPEAAYCGALVELDTIHILAPDGSRIYVYTIIDLFSRWAYAEVAKKIGAETSARFVRRAERKAPFRFEMVQTDHGSEFSMRFTPRLAERALRHRHSSSGLIAQCRKSVWTTPSRISKRLSKSICLGITASARTWVLTIKLRSPWFQGLELI